MGTERDWCCSGGILLRRVLDMEDRAGMVLDMEERAGMVLDMEERAGIDLHHSSRLYAVRSCEMGKRLKGQVELPRKFDIMNASLREGS
jgi:hypothetical protein